MTVKAVTPLVEKHLTVLVQTKLAPPDKADWHYCKTHGVDCNPATADGACVAYCGTELTPEDDFAAVPPPGDTTCAVCWENLPSSCDVES